MESNYTLIALNKNASYFKDELSHVARIHLMSNDFLNQETLWSKMVEEETAKNGNWNHSL